MYFFTDNRQHELNIGGEKYIYIFRDNLLKKYSLILHKTEKTMHGSVTPYKSKPIVILFMQTASLTLENGDKWEGTELDGKPFGYGCIYNKNGSLLYNGFVANGLKIGYGEEYNVNSGTIEYAGSFMKNERHGYGKLFDESSTMIYEGYWACGSNTIFKYNMNTGFHSLIEELVIEGVGNGKPFVLCDYYYVLKRLTFRDNSNAGVTKCCIKGLNMLTDILFGVKSFYKARSSFNKKQDDKEYVFEISDCQALQYVKTGLGSFNCYSVLKLDNLPNLYELDLGETEDFEDNGSENSFTDLKSFELKDLPSLRTLYMGYRVCINTPSFTLKNLPKLKEIIVNGSSFKNVKYFSLYNLPSLNFVNFGSNSFEKVESVTLKNVPFNGEYSAENCFVTVGRVNTDGDSESFRSCIQPIDELSLPGISKNATEITLGLLEYEDSEDEIDGYDDYEESDIVNYGRDLHDDLEISGYLQVKSIYITGYALPNISSLRICDNPMLETIDICGNDDREEDYSFYSTKDVTICDLPKLKTISLNQGEFFNAEDFSLFNLPVFTSLKMGCRSFYHCRSCSFSNLPQFEVLDIEGGVFYDLNSMTLSDLPKLKSLSICNTCNKVDWIDIKKVPFTNGKFSSRTGLHYISADKIDCDEGRIWIGVSLIDSTALKQALLSNYGVVEMTSFYDRDSYMLEFEGASYDNKAGDLFIRNFPHLYSLDIKYSMFESVRSVTICDNPSLVTINIEEDDCYEPDRHPYYFPSARSLTIENLPKLGTIKICYRAFPKVKELTLSNLPNLYSLENESESFLKLQTIILKNVPFEDGELDFRLKKRASVKSDQVSRGFKKMLDSSTKIYRVKERWGYNRNDGSDDGNDLFSFY